MNERIQSDANEEKTIGLNPRHAPLGGLLRGRTATRLDARQVVAAEAFPVAVETTILDVVKRTRLWRGEKADVARELCAHFRDGLSAGRSADQLVGSFGDSRQAAKLIRRAKQRGRPLHWRLARGLGQFAVAVIGFYAAMVVWFYFKSPSVTRDFLAEFNQSTLSVPVADRAWPALRELHSQAKPEYQNFPYDATEQGPRSEDWPEVATWLDKNKQLLPALRAAAAKPHLGFVYGETDDTTERLDAGRDDSASLERSGGDHLPVIVTLLPYAQAVRVLSWLLTADAHAAAAAGEPDRVAQNLTASIQLADMVYRESHFLVEQLVAFAILRNTEVALVQILLDHPELMNTDHLRDLAHRLASVGGGGRLRVQLSGELASFEDVLQRVYSDDGRGNGSLTPTGIQFGARLGIIPSLSNSEARASTVLALVLPGVSMVVASRAEQYQAFKSCFDEFERHAAKPMWEWRGPADDVQVLLGSESDIVSPRLRFAPVFYLFPPVQPSAVAAELATLQRDATLAVLALHVYRRENKQWPTTLAELVPRYLPEVPKDRFDGQPLRYQLREGKPLLYSVGGNLTDDGGRRPRNRDEAGQVRRFTTREEVDNHRRSGNLNLIPDVDWVFWPPAPLPSNSDD